MRSKLLTFGVFAGVSLITLASCFFLFFHFNNVGESVREFFRGFGNFFIWVMVPSIIMWFLGHLFLAPTSRTRIVVFLVICGIVMTFIALLAAFEERGSVFHILGGIVGLFISVPTLVLWQIISLVGVIAFRSPTSVRIWREGTIVIALMLVLVVVHILSYFCIALPIAEHDVTMAKQFCERTLIPRIGMYHKAKGAYPQRIDEILAEKEPLPWLLRKRNFYQQCGINGNEFSIQFADPRGMFVDTWGWSSTRPTWIEDVD